MVENAYAQLAKINRKTVKMTVQPEVVLQGNQCAITLERYQPVDTYRLSIFSSAYDLIHQEKLTISEKIFSKTVDLPDGTKGQINIVFEGKINELWAPFVEKTISIIPGFGENIQSTIDDLQQLERQYKDENSIMLRSVWALLAYGEDLMERAKSAGPYDAWDLQRRLSSLQSKTQTLQKARNPYDKNTGYVLRGYRSPLNQEIIKNNNIVLFTTTDGSTWLNNHKDLLPIRIEDKTIEFAGKTLREGQCLSFIWPNPKNPSRYVLYNIAKDLKGLKSLRHHSERNSLNPALRGDFVAYDKNSQPIWGGLFNKKWEIETKDIFQ